MPTSDHQAPLKELAFCTTFLAGALSLIDAPTFCELLFASMLAADVFVTQPLLSIDYCPKRRVFMNLFLFFMKLIQSFWHHSF